MPFEMDQAGTSAGGTNDTASSKARLPLAEFPKRTIKQEPVSKPIFEEDYSSYDNLSDVDDCIKEEEEWLLVSARPPSSNRANTAVEKGKAPKSPPLHVWPAYTHGDEKDKGSLRDEPSFARAVGNSSASDRQSNNINHKQHALGNYQSMRTQELKSWVASMETQSPTFGARCAPTSSLAVGHGEKGFDQDHRDDRFHRFYDLPPSEEIERGERVGVSDDAYIHHNLAFRSALHFALDAGGDKTVDNEKSNVYSAANSRPYFQEAIDPMEGINTVLDTQALDEFFASLVRDGIITAEEAHRRSGRLVHHKTAAELKIEENDEMYAKHEMLMQVVGDDDVANWLEQNPQQVSRWRALE